MSGFFTLFLASFISLFSIVDPIVAAPVFVSVTARDSQAKRNRQARDAAWYMLIILAAFFAAGSFILKFFGISLPGIKIAGGMMIITSAWSMLAEQKKLNKEEIAESKEKDDVAFSPIAMPMLSGPGAIAVLIGMTAKVKSWEDYAAIGLAILAVTALSWLVLRLSGRIVNAMGPTLINAMTKMMGFLVLCIGVQFLVDGVSAVVLERFITGH